MEKILYQGRDLETLTDEEIEELEMTEYGASIIVPEEEAEKIQLGENENYLFERIKKVRVVRNGKRMIKFKTDKPGYRVQKVGNIAKEVKMKPDEIRKRERGQRIAAKKRKGKQATSQKKRKLSLKKRIVSNTDYKTGFNSLFGD